MNEKTSDSQEKQQNKPESKPNDVGGFYFSSHLKISDPNSNEILVQIRGD